MAPETHSTLCGGSNCHRRIECPGSAAMESRSPEPPPSKFAEEGTRAHELCELMLRPLVYWYEKDGRDARDQPGVFEAATFDNYPTDMIGHCKDFTNLIMDLVFHYHPKKVLIEKKLTLSKKYNMFGTADIFFVVKPEGKTVLVLFDFKYGAGHAVEVTTPQLVYYAVAVQESYPKVKFDEFWLNIYQPRAEHKDGAHRQRIVSKEEIDKWKTLLLDVAKRAYETKDLPPEKLTLKAGDHCNWCRAKAVCPAYAGHLEKNAAVDFLDDPSVIVPAVMDQRRELKNFVSDERLSKILTYRKEIEQFIKVCEEYAINRFLAGNPVPGWKVVEGRTQRRWREEVGDVARGLQQLGVKEPWNKKLRGIGEIEEELKGLGVANPKGETIKHLTTKTEPGRTLAPESDKRASIDKAGQAKKDFEPVQLNID